MWRHWVEKSCVQRWRRWTDDCLYQDAVVKRIQLRLMVVKTRQATHRLRANGTDLSSLLVQQFTRKSNQRARQGYCLHWLKTVKSERATAMSWDRAQSLFDLAALRMGFERWDTFAARDVTTALRTTRAVLLIESILRTRAFNIWRSHSTVRKSIREHLGKQLTFSHKAYRYQRLAAAFLRLTVSAHVRKTFQEALARGLMKAEESVGDMRERLETTAEELAGARKILSTRGINAQAVERAQSSLIEAEKKASKYEELYKKCGQEWNIARKQLQGEVSKAQATELATEKENKRLKLEIAAFESRILKIPKLEEALEESQQEFALYKTANTEALEKARSDIIEVERVAARGKLAEEEVNQLRSALESREREVWRLEGDVRRLRSYSDTTGPNPAKDTVKAASHVESMAKGGTSGPDWGTVRELEKENALLRARLSSPTQGRVSRQRTTQR